MLQRSVRGQGRMTRALALLDARCAALSLPAPMSALRGQLAPDLAALSPSKVSAAALKSLSAVASPQKAAELRAGLSLRRCGDSRHGGVGCWGGISCITAPSIRPRDSEMSARPRGLAGLHCAMSPASPREAGPGEAPGACRGACESGTTALPVTRAGAGTPLAAVVRRVSAQWETPQSERVPDPSRAAQGEGQSSSSCAEEDSDGLRQGVAWSGEGAATEGANVDDRHWGALGLASCSGPPRSAWRAQLERLRRGCRWVGALDSAVEDVMEEIAEIDEDLMRRAGSQAGTDRDESGPCSSACSDNGGDTADAAALSVGSARPQASSRGVVGAVQASPKQKRKADKSSRYSSSDDDLYQGPVADELERRYKEKYMRQGLGGEALHRSFAARQVATKLLLSLPRLCPTCWLEPEDCICAHVQPVPPGPGVHIWVYIHPKEFLHKNNTGKLLWQVLGEQHAHLCITGIKSHEDHMLQTMLDSGAIWCLYPSRGDKPYTPANMPLPERINGAFPAEQVSPVHFIVIDGTWNTSRAMVTRLKEQLSLRSPTAELQFLSLEGSGPSVMHNIRIQPSKEKICTAAAVSRLLLELSQRSELQALGLSESAAAINRALAAMLDSLARRRLRTGLSALRLGVGKNQGYLHERKRS